MPTKQPVEHINARHVNAALHAAREGRSLRFWRDAFVPGAAGWQTLLGADVVYNLAPGERIVITSMCCSVNTFNDNCLFRIGWCDQIDGGGICTPMVNNFHLITGGAIAGAAERIREYVSYLTISYAQGARSIAMQINPNDALCNVAMCWAGWHEVGD